MHFDPIDFFKLAKNLYQNSLTSDLKDATLRTVASRVYYACFLTYRELLRQLLMNEKFNKLAETGAVHSCMRRLLKVLNMELGNFISSLHKMRKIADYELKEYLTEKKVEEALVIAERILNVSSIQIIKQSYEKRRKVIQEELDRIYNETLGFKF